MGTSGSVRVEVGNGLFYSEFCITIVVYSDKQKTRSQLFNPSFCLGGSVRIKWLPQVGIVTVGADPDKRLAQGHGAVERGNILKEIVDVAINDLPACYRASAVFLIAQALAFIELNLVVVNGIA